MSHLFASTKRNAEFHDLFKIIPQEELLIDSYSCALSREILIHGRLYLSANYICFNANILGWVTNIVVHLKDIISVEKKMTALIIPNGITLSTLHTRHVYASFLKRDDAYYKICRIWKNCIADKPIPTTELLSQISSGKAPNEDANEDLVLQKWFRERKASVTIDSGIESIMSDDCSISGDLDPALTVRREYNFGSSRSRMNYISKSGSIDESLMEMDEIVNSPDYPTEEEQKEVRESIFPCSCAFHYKNTLIDQLVMVPMNNVIEGILFPPKTMITSVPRAFQKTLKELGARDVKFSPWKVYLGKWERRIWSCEITARKLLLHEAYLNIKVTDSIICRNPNRICVESLMQIDGIPGGGSFVKWKLCITSKADAAVSDQCRITITAAAASPLGSWFKESIRTALLQQAEELWVLAIENAASLDYSDDPNADVRSISFSGSVVTRSTDTLSKLLFPQTLHGSSSVNSVALTFFDRKAFFLSLTRLTAAIVVLLVAVILGNRVIYRNDKIKIIMHDDDANNIKNNFESAHKIFEFNRFAEGIQREYEHFLDKKLNLNSSKNYIGLIEESAEDFAQLDGQLSELVRRVYRIQRELDGGGKTE